MGKRKTNKTKAKEDLWEDVRIACKILKRKGADNCTLNALTGIVLGPCTQENISLMYGLRHQMEDKHGISYRDLSGLMTALLAVRSAPRVS